MAFLPPNLARARVPLALVRSSATRPAIALTVWIAWILVWSPGLFALDVDTSTDSVLDRSGAEWGFYEESQELFGGDEIVVVALVSAEPFDQKSMGSLNSLSDVLSGIAGVERVDSLTTLPVVRVGESGGVDLTPALTDFDANPDEAVQRAIRLASSDRIIPNTLLSTDGRTIALTVVLKSGTESQHDRILRNIRLALGDSDALVSGVPVFRVEANRNTRTEILRFAPLTVLLVSMYLWFAFRSLRAIAVCLAPGVSSTVLVLSWMGLSGVPLSITTMILPSILIALGAAYSMHILIAASGHPDAASIALSFEPVALPLALSGLTTVVGFLSLAFVGIDAVRHVGVCGAAGVLLAVVFTLTATPAMITAFPILKNEKLATRLFDKRMSHQIVRLVIVRRPVIFAVCILLGGVLGLGLMNVKVETDVTTWLRRGHPVRDAYEGIRSELSGISPVNLVISSRQGKSVLEPDALVAIDAFVGFLEQQPEVGRAVSVSDPIRQLHQSFSGSDSILPQTRMLAEQYMLLLDGVEMMSSVVTPDRSHANILIRVDDNGSSDILSLASRAEAWWRSEGARSYEVNATGIMYEFARAEDEIAYGQIRGLVFALLTVTAVLLLIFRSIPLALVALVPNALPLGVVFGTMGLLGVPIDAGTVLIGGLALGVAVDDTIHLMTHYVQNLQKEASIKDALARSFESVLPAMASSTMMVAIGFGVFVFSEFSLTRNLGWLTASVMVVCLLADVLVLGALLSTGIGSRLKTVKMV